MKVFRKIVLLLICFIMSLSVVGCAGGGDGGSGGGTGGNTGGSTSDLPASCDISFANYSNVQACSDISAYEAGVVDNRAVPQGVIISPYYTMIINGETVPVYASRSANGIHSFAYIDVLDTEDEGFNLNVKITVNSQTSVMRGSNPKVVVLPQSHGVEAVVNKETMTVSAVLSDYGSYSFVFNKKHKDPITIMVAESIDKTELFGNYEIEYITPGDYATATTNSQTIFTEENTVYYFSAGYYKIDSIELPSNSILYTEIGAYLELFNVDTNKYALKVQGSEQNQLENVKVVGRGLIDYSSCNGSWLEGHGEYYTPQKSHLWFWWINNLEISGMTVINSNTWTVYVESCKNVHVSNMFLIAYKTYADGIMLSNCIDSVVEKSFARTGDDAFEVKSRNASTRLTNNVIFQYCDAWTDKALAYGVVYECHNDTRNVIFRNCSVGFALGNWSSHLGCCVIQLGEQARPNRVNENIYFENIEIYQSFNKAILNCYVGGLPARKDDGSGHINNIYFKNITCETNYGKVLNVETYDTEDCSIGNIYIDNVVSNKTKVTSANIEDLMINAVKTSSGGLGGYDMSKLFIDTRI